VGAQLAQEGVHARVRGSEVERQKPIRRPARLRLELARQLRPALGERVGQLEAVRHLEQER
jgi:hypothetical protein